MKKLILTLVLLVSGLTLAQNASRWEQDYYGAGGRYSNNLQIAVSDTTTGEYYINDQPITIAVDSNWTASNLGVWVYNDYEDAYEPLQDDGGTLIEITITQGKTTALNPAIWAGVKRCKFTKITSGSYVAQATNATSIIITTIKY